MPKYILRAGALSIIIIAQAAGAVKPIVDVETLSEKQISGLHAKVDPMLDREPDWLSSRLQMFWDSHSTDVFINGEFFERAGGKKAPAPTVMLSGSRGHATNYARPKLDELTPYQEDPRGMWLANTKLDGRPMEWAPIKATGNIIQSINQEILGYAKDAATLWRVTNDDRYADIAARIFDTYLTGIYYRNMPYDLNHGHQQTLVGMQSFEVIHEDALNYAVAAYDMLKPYLAKHYPDKKEIYDEGFKKWAEVIIANGVPHNNWDLMQVRFVLYVAMILDDDAAYDDGKGQQYYIDYVLNRSSIRQWSLKQLADYGYDPETAIWAECGGYSQVVINDITDIAMLVDRQLGIDLVAELPIIAEAAAALPQYLFPDSYIIGFGDTHPGTINPAIWQRMIDNARHFGKSEQETRFIAMQNAPNAELVTPTFYAPNASWLVARNGMDRNRSLSFAVNGSEGNHMHANGISMELYGRGLRLGPDAGIGYSLYSGQDYLEYYSRFPAHNTVCVDGISDYPVMKSNHPLRLISCFPEPGMKLDFPAVMYSEVAFREPETDSDQRRLNALITIGDSAGYYIDIFRSRRNDGNDRFHDYFYHNMGQRMTLAGADGSNLNLQPTDELAFAGAHLYAYSYIFDKNAATTDSDLRADFIIDMPDSTITSMAMWMKGSPERTVFKALSPSTEGLSRMPGMPYNIKEQPTLTYIARQQGEAWTRPFVAIFEPQSTGLPGTIATVEFPEVSSDAPSAVAIKVTHNDGITDLILSSDTPDSNMYSSDIQVRAAFAFSNANRMMLGNGTYLKTHNVEISAKTPADILIELHDGSIDYISSAPFTLKLGKHKYTLPASATKTTNIVKKY